MLLSQIEYVFLRVLRRNFVSDKFLERFGGVIPFYLKSPNQNDPRVAVDKYELCAKRNGLSLKGKIVLELGPGVTNSTAYELSARGCAWIYAYEPYAEFNEKVDEKMISSICGRYDTDREKICRNVQRVTSLDSVPDKGIELVLSHSVLEHVLDPGGLFDELYGKLTSDGVMIHHVDYRDHFFKYPFHKLLFSKETWRQWLDPGNLPGWLLKDHLEQYQRAGFETSLDNVLEDSENLEKIKKFISEDYDREDPLLSVKCCNIVVKKTKRKTFNAEVY